MKMKNKMIFLVIFMFLLIPAVSGITMEEQTFYDSIKEISDIENKTDFLEEQLIGTENTTPEEIKNFCEDKIEVISTEIYLLENLKTKLTDEDYMEYVNIEINRLENENKSYTAILEYADIYNQYLHGKLNTTTAESILEDKAWDVNYYSHLTDEYKYKAETFLNGYTYMKVKFNELGIDNDFMYSQNYEDISESLI